MWEKLNAPIEILDARAFEERIETVCTCVPGPNYRRSGEFKHAEIKRLGRLELEISREEFPTRYEHGYATNRILRAMNSGRRVRLDVLHPPLDLSIELPFEPNNHGEHTAPTSMVWVPFIEAESTRIVWPNEEEGQGRHELVVKGIKTVIMSARSIRYCWESGKMVDLEVESARIIVREPYRERYENYLRALNEIMSIPWSPSKLLVNESDPCHPTEF